MKDYLSISYEFEEEKQREKALNFLKFMNEEPTEEKIKDFIEKTGKKVSVNFYIEDEKVLKIGEKMNKISEEAYMNGQGWADFIYYYLENNEPELLENYHDNPEAGLYEGIYQGKDKNENLRKARRLAQILEDLIENEEKLYEIIEEEGEEIGWI